ncbi:Transcription factor E2F4 [Geodia barretti]|uniref:Transcription factor E2F4 n=1 Tax=Geodia barretti TaxID=519541 RepID=A0AA35TQ10_GEOBA|nr:Transcription factor E2F4 [Geodia barretti]
MRRQAAGESQGGEGKGRKGERERGVEESGSVSGAAAVKVSIDEVEDMDTKENTEEDPLVKQPSISQDSEAPKQDSLTLSEVPLTMLQLSPAPGDQDFLYHLGDREGVCDLYDLISDPSSHHPTTTAT